MKSSEYLAALIPRPGWRARLACSGRGRWKPEALASPGRLGHDTPGKRAPLRCRPVPPGASVTIRELDPRGAPAPSPFPSPRAENASCAELPSHLHNGRWSHQRRSARSGSEDIDSSAIGWGAWGGARPALAGLSKGSARRPRPFRELPRWPGARPA